MMKPNDIYLDNSATTPLAPDVLDAMIACRREQYMNPASAHRPGQTARRRLENARRCIIESVGGTVSGMETDQLIFTSGGTESNNLALLGLLNELVGSKSPGRIILSAIEHPSILAMGEYLKTLGHQVELIPVDNLGICDLDVLAELLKQPTQLVSMMLVNHEIGTLQPIVEAAQLCHNKGALIHCDAVQAVGKMPVDFGELGIDAMTFTAHKLHGPRGIGALLLKHGVRIQPLLYGGFQQMALRPGTEDVALVVGLETALQAASVNIDARQRHLADLRDKFVTSLLSFCPDVQVNGHPNCHAPHILNLAKLGCDRQSVLLAADISGLAISTGSACASGSSELSPVLLAMGLDKPATEASFRVSLSVFNTLSEVIDASQRLARIFDNLGQF